MRDRCFDVTPVAHRMNSFQGDLLVSSGTDDRAGKEGEELRLCRVDLNHLFWNVKDLFFQKTFHWFIFDQPYYNLIYNNIKQIWNGWAIESAGNSAGSFKNKLSVYNLFLHEFDRAFWLRQIQITHSRVRTWVYPQNHRYYTSPTTSSSKQSRDSLPSHHARRTLNSHSRRFRRYCCRTTLKGQFIRNKDGENDSRAHRRRICSHIEGCHRRFNR